MNWDHLGLFTIQGSEDLKPESNNYLSLSGEYTKNKLNGSLTVYHNRFKNKIEGQWTAGETIYQYINVSKSNISGAEIALKYRVFKSFNISGGYSYLYDNNSAGGVRLSTVSPHSTNIRFEYKLRKGFYNATFNLSGKIYGANKVDWTSIIEANENGYTVDDTLKIMEAFTGQGVTYMTSNGNDVFKGCIDLEYGAQGPVYTPNDHIYVMKTAKGKYAKVLITGFYDDNGNSGYISFKYSYQNGDGRKFE